jgi:hypothetical protein
MVNLVVGDLADLAPPPGAADGFACYSAAAAAANKASSSPEEPMCPYQFARSPPRVGQAMFGVRMAPDTNVGFETLPAAPAPSQP